MNNKLKLIAAGVGALGLCAIVPQASANVILAGKITFGGAGGNQAAATVSGGNITSVTGAIVNGPSGSATTGSYATLIGQSAKFYTPISLTASTTPDGVELWSVADGLGDTYEFFSTGNTAVQTITLGQTTVEELSGTGFAEEVLGANEPGPTGGSGSGVTLANVLAGPSYGTWGITLNSSDAGVTFSFTGTSTTAPDGGLTVALLGGAFCALGAVRRKLGRK